MELGPTKSRCELPSHGVCQHSQRHRVQTELRGHARDGGIRHRLGNHQRPQGQASDQVPGQPLPVIPPEPGQEGASGPLDPTTGQGPAICHVPTSSSSAPCQDPSSTPAGSSPRGMIHAGVIGVDCVPWTRTTAPASTKPSRRRQPSGGGGRARRRCAGFVAGVHARCLWRGLLRAASGAVGCGDVRLPRPGIRAWTGRVAPARGAGPAAAVAVDPPRLDPSPSVGHPASTRPCSGSAS